MTPKSKQLLKEALYIYNNASAKKKPSLIQEIKDNLSRHYKNTELTGMGLASDFVQAGRIFLRIKDKH